MELYAFHSWRKQKKRGKNKTEIYKYNTQDQQLLLYQKKSIKVTSIFSYIAQHKT